MKAQSLVNRNLPMLSRQDCLIIAHLAEGYTDEQIGEKFGLSPKTVQQHLKDMMRKQGATHSYELISWAYLNGFLK